MSGEFRQSAIVRPRLIDPICAAEGRVIITAGAGSGKTFLANQLRQFCDRQVADEPGHSCLPGLADDAVVLVRSLPEGLSISGDEFTLTDSDIWFTEEEVYQLLEQELGSHPAHGAVAAAIHTFTAGWPAAVGVLVRLLAHRPLARRQMDRLALRGPHYAQLFTQTLQGMPQEFLDEAGEIANLPIALPSFFDQFRSCPGWNEARRIGLPFRLDPDGFLTLPEPLRLHLAARRSLSHDVAVRCGLQLVEMIGLDNTMGILMEAEAWEPAEAVLLSTPESTRFQASHAALLHRLRYLVTLLDANPDTLFTIAGLAMRLGRFEECAQDIERCVGAARQYGAETTLLRAEIMSLLVATRKDATPVGSDVFQQLEQQQQLVGNRMSELELEELRFVEGSGHDDAATKVAAVALGLDLAYKLAAMGENEPGAEILRQVAVGPVLDLGRYRQMVQLADEASAMAGEILPSGRHLVIQALALALAGDLGGHEQAVNKLQAVHGTLSASWLDAYLWGARMVASSVSGSVEGVQYAFNKYQESIGELADTPSGIQWMGIAASAFAVVGAKEAANDALGQARLGRHHDRPGIGLAELVVAARVDDPARAEGAHQELIGHGMLSPEKKWRADLELLVAADRLGTSIDVDLETILDAAAGFGLGGLAFELAKPLRVKQDSGDKSFGMNVFGEFKITTNEGPVEFTKGKPVELLKILVLRGRPVHVESLIHALWPESSADVGRRRMKNVLNRARALLEPNAIVRQGESLALSKRVDSDLQQYRMLVATASAAPPGSEVFVSAARAALDLARGGLLPDDPYAEWAADDRWHVESTTTRLLADLVRCSAEQVHPEWLIDVAGDLGVLDDAVYQSIADQAVAAGLEPAAARARRTAQRLAADIHD